MELCQSQVRTLWVNLPGNGNQSIQEMYRTFSIPEDIMKGTGEAVQGGNGRGWLVFGCPAPQRPSRALGQCWGSGLPPAA